MDQAKRDRLEANGFRVGEVQDFPGLRDDELAYIDLCTSLKTAVRTRREDAGLTQHALAKRLGSTKTLVARMEAGDPSASLDLMVRALLASGVSVPELARMIAPERADHAA